MIILILFRYFILSMKLIKKMYLNNTRILNVFRLSYFNYFFHAEISVTINSVIKNITQKIMYHDKLKQYGNPREKRSNV